MRPRTDFSLSSHLRIVAVALVFAPCEGCASSAIVIPDGMDGALQSGGIDGGADTGALELGASAAPLS
jgi:hypothetical protein